MRAARFALLLGASSQPAPFLSRRLAEAGHAGACLSRTPPPDAPPIDAAFPWRRADVAMPVEWPAMPGGVVVSALPLWLLPAHVSALAAAGMSQLVAFSSTSAATKAGSPDPAERALAARLAEAEAAVAAACDAIGIPWTLLRPTLIYGSGRDRNVSAVAGFIRRCGCFPVAHPASGLRQPVHADDLAQAAVAALGNPAAYRRTFDLPGGETLSYRAMVERIFAGMGRAPRVVPVSAAWLRAALPLLGDRLPQRYGPALFARMNQDLVFDATPAREALGYAPRPFRFEPPDPR